MFVLDFSVAISVYLCLFIALLLFVWISGRREEDKDSATDPKFIHTCLICAYTYINTRGEPITVCPRCGSYNKRPGEDERKSS